MLCNARQVHTVQFKEVRKGRELKVWYLHLSHFLMQEDVEDGMVVLQALVEGMVLEVHVTNRQALESGSTPQVEIYTQFGSQVSIYMQYVG